LHNTHHNIFVIYYRNVSFFLPYALGV